MPWVYIGTSPLQAAYVGTTPVKEIYVWTTKVRPTRNPWANTLFYLPLKNNISDASWHVNTSWWGSISYQNPWAYIPSRLTINYTTNPTSFTYMWYFKAPNSSSYAVLWFKASITSSWYYWWDLYYNASWANTLRIEFLKYRYSNVWQQSYSVGSSTSWHHICLVNDLSNMWYIYVDWVLAISHSISWFSLSGNPVYVAGDGDNNNNPIYAWDIIMEDKARTAQEITDYYNQTKANYWL